MPVSATLPKNSLASVTCLGRQNSWSWPRKKYIFSLPLPSALTYCVYDRYVTHTFNFILTYRVRDKYVSYPIISSLAYRVRDWYVSHPINFALTYRVNDWYVSHPINFTPRSSHSIVSYGFVSILRLIGHTHDREKPMQNFSPAP